MLGVFIEVSVKEATSWYSDRVEQSVRVVRWGEVGRPVLVFPTAGGDAEEIERFLLIEALSPLLAAGRIKVYSMDSIAGRAWIHRVGHPHHRAWLQNRFDAFVYHEVVPAIRADCRLPNDAPILATGASLGAFNALASICRHPDAFDAAICMSGTYDFTKFLEGAPVNDDFHFASPIHFLPDLPEGEHLTALRRRFVLLATGEGRWENAGETWHVAHVLGTKGVPNRVELWGPHYDHDWPTWRDMLPKYLNEIS